MSALSNLLCSCHTNKTNLADELVLWSHLDEFLAENATEADYLIPALQLTQDLFGYLPEPAIDKIAAAFDMSFSAMAGLISFYSHFTTKPRGQHTIRVCLGTACYVRGGKTLLKSLKQKLGIDVGETTEDRQFSLTVGRCFGACSLAPVMIINGEIQQRVKPSHLGPILAQYRQQNLSETENLPETAELETKETMTLPEKPEANP